MAKISTYVVNSIPVLSDKVIGTDVVDMNITKNYLLSDIFALFQAQSGGGYVPYIGANANVDLGANSITANSFIVGGGLSSQFLKADGSVDSTSYVPYTGANANVNLGSYNITANSFIKAGGTSSQFLKADGSVDSNTYVGISNTQTITGLKTFSNTLTLTNVVNTLSDPDKFLVLNGGNTVAYRTGAQVLSDIGGADAASYVPYTGATSNVNLGIYDVIADAFIKTGGTSSQFLKADGSIDGNTYVTVSTTQTISGAKTFSNTLTLTSVANAAVDTDKFLVLNAGNTVDYRTGAQLISDSLTLTTTGTSGAATLVGGTLNIPNYAPDLSGYVTIGTTQTITGAKTFSNTLTLTSVANATTDTDKFLVSDSGVVKYRTGAELASDIGITKYYGSFYDILDQSITTVSTGQPVLVRNTDATMTSGFSVVSNSRVTAAYSGKYNVMFSFQLHNNGGGGSGDTVEIWFVKNGVALADSNTRISVSTNNPYVVAAWNYFVPLNAGDYVEVYWATNNANIGIDYNTGSMGGPAIPSAIITINQVN
jgi:hypothetical protein